LLLLMVMMTMILLYPYILISLKVVPSKLNYFEKLQLQQHTKTHTQTYIYNFKMTKSDRIYHFRVDKLNITDRQIDVR